MILSNKTTKDNETNHILMHLFIITVYRAITESYRIWSKSPCLLLSYCIMQLEQQIVFTVCHACYYHILYLGREWFQKNNPQGTKKK